MTRSHTKKNRAPEDDENATRPRNIKFLEEQIDRELPRHVSQIEDSCEPGILVVDKVSILFHAPKCSVGDARLVEELQNIILEIELAWQGWLAYLDHISEGEDGK